MATEFSDEFEGLEGESTDESESGSESRSPEGSAGSAGGDGSPKADKRVNDLMSNWQKAEARAAAAEKLLAELQGGSSAAAPLLGDTSPEVRVFLDQILEGEIDRLYSADTRLASYGVDRNALWAPTPSEVKANAERFKVLLDRMETQIENRVMTRHGVSASVVAGRTAKPRNWDAMPAEEFQKVLADERRRF